MKRKYREAMRAKARQPVERDDDDEAVEARDWFEEWAMGAQQEEMNNNQGSQEWKF